MKGLTENFESIIAFALVIGAAVWIGTIYMAEREQKLVQACVPVDYATNALHHVTTALVGYPPRWTLSLQSYLMGGCYYFFSVMIPDQDDNISTTPLAPQGGIRTH